MPGILTPEDKVVLANELNQPQYAGLEREAILEAINAPVRIETPVPAVAQISWDDVLDRLEPAQVREILKLPAVTTIVAQVNAQDRLALSHWVSSLLKGEFITPVEVGKMQALLTATAESVAVSFEPSRFQQLFPNRSFEVRGADSAIVNVVSGTCLPAMIEEALS